jgi:hypothetical protein
LRGAQRRSKVEEGVRTRYSRFLLGLGRSGFYLFNASFFGRTLALYLLEFPK